MLKPDTGPVATLTNLNLQLPKARALMKAEDHDLSSLFGYANEDIPLLDEEPSVVDFTASSQQLETDSVNSTPAAAENKADSSEQATVTVQQQHTLQDASQSS